MRTAEQEEFARSVRDFLRTRHSYADVRRLLDEPRPYDRQVWQEMATQLGLAGMCISEEHGGLGYTFEDLAPVFETTGAALLVSPLFATVALATPVILCSGDEAAHRELLPRIADGSTTATLAFEELRGGDRDTRMVGERRGDAWILNGAKAFVLDGATADLLLVTANTPAGTTLFWVDPAQPGVERSPMTVLDASRPQAVVRFEDVSAEQIGSEGLGADVLAAAVPWTLAALAAEQVGGSRAALEMAVGYAKEREQFGRIIGSFQAIKHLCADMLIRVESAAVLADSAFDSLAGGQVQSRRASNMAKAFCSETYSFVAAENIQVHGGIGFTWEHDAHLHFRRAKSSHAMFGTPSTLRERIAAEMQL